MIRSRDSRDWRETSGMLDAGAAGVVASVSSVTREGALDALRTAARGLFDLKFHDQNVRSCDCGWDD